MSKWTPEQDARLRYLVEVEKFKLRDAAVKMGLTHMSVVGRCFRLNIKPQHTKGGYRRPSDNFIMRAKRIREVAKSINSIVSYDKRKSRKTSCGKDALRNPIFFKLSGSEKKLADLGNDECRFPLTHPELGTLFCAAQAAENESYCPAHRTACYEVKKVSLEELAEG